jgi:putative oxidoreductase
MIQKFFTDLPLCIFSLLPLGLWFSARAASRRNRRPAPFDWQTAAATYLRIACGIILAYASLDKLGNPVAFSGAVASYRVLPPALIPLAAIVVSWLEFFAGLCLALGFQWRGAALVFFALMGMYASTMAWDLLRGVDLNCKCFNIQSTEPATWLTVLRDVLLFAMGWIVLFSRRTYATLNQWSAGRGSRP